jgi:hypothetical protein
MLVGLGAAAGAVGVAVMMSAVSAPTARADDFTDTIATVETQIADGQVAFSAAASDFGSNLLTPGAAAFFDGVDDDLLLAPNTLLGGTIEGLLNEPYDFNALLEDLPIPGTFADGLTEAQTIFAASADEFHEAAMDFAAGDYGHAAFFDLDALNLASVIPLEEVLLGSIASL